MHCIDYNQASKVCFSVSVSTIAKGPWFMLTFLLERDDVSYVPFMEKFVVLHENFVWYYFATFRQNSLTSIQSLD